MIEITIKKEVYDDPEHCSYIMGRDKCNWLNSSGPICQLFRIQLEYDTDRFMAIKCDECKAAHLATDGLS